MKSSKNIIEEYLKKQDWRVNENSNAPFSFGAMNKYITGEVSKDYWLREVYPEYISQAYVDGHIHIHDLGGLSLYCCGYSLKDILLKGVRGIPNIPVSKPAKHFDSVLNQLANLTTIFQNEILGAVAFNGFDTLLAPFVKLDKLTYNQVKQSMQNYIFSINSNSRAGAEPAFSNITFDLTPPIDMVDEYAIVGGEEVSFTYGSCQQEMDMINRAFFEIMYNGDGEGKLFAYPIPTYNIHERFDWDNPNNKMLWEMAGKYGTPYFANFLNSDLDITDVRSMCPLKGDTEIVYYSDRFKKWNKSTIKYVYDSKKRDKNAIVKTIANGKVIECKINKFDIPANYTITLCNGLSIKTTSNHLNKVYGKDYVETKDLTSEDYLPLYKRPTNISNAMTYEQGKLIGMYLGDGSIDHDGIVIFSLNRETKQHLIDFLYDYAVNYYNAKITECDCISQISGKTSCVNVRVFSKSLAGLINQFVSGSNALNKSLSADIVGTSEEFRRGIVDGLYETDGGNRNRIYTSSENMVSDLTLLFATLGMGVRVNKDKREGRLGKNPCYCVRYYTLGAKTKHKDVYIVDDNYAWFKIQSVAYTPHNSDSVSYCLEVLDDDAPEEFMLANGIVTHNCRLRIDLSALRKKNGGLFGAGDSTGSIGVVTINLPRIAYETKGDKEKFFSELTKYLDIAKDSLVIKREWLQKNIIDTHAVPAFIEYVGTLDNHFSTIGIISMNEMCLNFMGKDIVSDEGKAFALEVGEFIKNKLIEYQKECGCLFNYEATPAESTCYRLALADKKVYPDIITQGEGKDVYYTNSCHIPVKDIVSINETFKHQEALQAQFSGGTVIHCYLEGGISGEQAKTIVKEMFSNYTVPYMSLSPVSRYCDKHGYIKEIVDKCPICKKKLKAYQRITGYLRCVDNFNRGKKAEFKDRKQLPTIMEET